MKFIGEQKRIAGHERAGEVLVKPVPWDATTEVRQNIGLLQDEIDQKIWADYFSSAVSYGYMLRVVDQKSEFPDIGPQALGRLKVTAAALKQRYMIGEAQLFSNHLEKPDDLLNDGALMVALFPKLRSDIVEAVSFAMNKLMDALEDGLESKDLDALKSFPHTLFNLRQLDSSGRSKALAQSLEPGLMEQYAAHNDQVIGDPDHAFGLIFNGLYLRLLFPERTTEVENVTQRALPVLKEFVQHQPQGLDRYLMTIYIALSEAQQLTVDEHGQLQAKLREPIHQTRETLPDRSSVE